MNKTNWKYIFLFYLIAILISAPVNLLYLSDFWKEKASGTFLENSGFLLAGFGTFFAGLLAIKLHKNIVHDISFLGRNRAKSILIVFVPTIVLSVAGLKNNYGYNNHVYAIYICLIALAYSTSEEFFWRNYLTNALFSIKQFQKYF